MRMIRIKKVLNVILKVKRILNL